ncbi:MAG: hypothetical protein ABI670_09030 [Chloroflexota bacterium]
MLKEEIDYDRVDRAWGVNGAMLLRKLQSFTRAETAVLFEIGEQAIATTGHKEWHSFYARLETNCAAARLRK